MRLLDLFCGAGGAAKGYHEAGFEVVGVDHKPQPRFPFEFIQADAIEFLELLIASGYVKEFDAIHLSPPCQPYSALSSLANRHPPLIKRLRKLLTLASIPYIIENVPGAPLINYVILCGTMFGLKVIRHRWFECRPMILFSPATCAHLRPVVPMGRRPDRGKHYAAVYGNFSDVEFGREGHRLDDGQGIKPSHPARLHKMAWLADEGAYQMTMGQERKLLESANAIYELRTKSEVNPPAYTEFKTLFPDATRQQYQRWLASYIEIGKELLKDRRFARITIIENTLFVSRRGEIRVYWINDMTKPTLNRWRSLLTQCDYSKSSEGEHEYFWEGRRYHATQTT